MAPSPPQFGGYYDERGEWRPIGSNIPFGGVLSSAGINLDAMLMNSLTGNPYAHQQFRMDGPNRRMTDIWLHEQQQNYFNFGTMVSDRYKERAMTGLFGGGVMDDPTALRKAKNAMSFYNPIGMAASLAMSSMGEAQADVAYAQAFMATNQYAPRLGTASSTFELERDKRTAFVNMMKQDLIDNPLGYGGMNWADQAQVMQQMAQRSQLGEADTEVTFENGKAVFGPRTQQTKQKVREMTKAVGAMQELFGGTIPELFDKMDAVFGGTASAMGGKQLESRILRLKQQSMITGQSLESIAQMSITGQQYAMGAGMDAGIGSNAALQTGYGFGVNVADGGFGTRRINEQRMKSLAVRMNVSAATSKLSQYYAGGYQIWRERGGGGKMSEADARAAWFARASGAGDVSDIARLAGGSVSAVQAASLSDDAKEMMNDDPNTANFAIQSRLSGVQRATAFSIQDALEQRYGRKFKMSNFMRGGKLLGSDQIAKNIAGMGYSDAVVSGIIDNQLEGAAKAYLGQEANGQELQKIIAQQREAGTLQEIANRRADLDERFSPAAGGPMGVLQMLASGKTQNISNYFSAAMGVVTGDDVLKRTFNLRGKEKIGDKISKKLMSMYKSGDSIQQGKIQSIMSSVASTRFMNLSRDDQLNFARNILEGNLDDAYIMTATEKQRDAEELLNEYGGESAGEIFGMTINAGEDAKAYREAIIKGDRKEKQRIGRRIATRSALGGIEDKAVRDRVRGKLFEGGKMREFKSIRAMEKELEGVEFGSKEARDKFIGDMTRGAASLDASDPALDMKNILARLAEAIEALVNKR